MLSLLFLIGAVTSLSMIVPGIETEDENKDLEYEAPDPNEADDQADGASSDFVSGSGVDEGDSADGAQGEEDPNSPQPDDSAPETTSEDGDTATDTTEPEAPTDGSQDGEEGSESSGAPDEPPLDEAGEEDEPAAPTLPASFSKYADAAQISLTYADGETAEIDLAEHKDIDLGSDDRGYHLYRIDLEDGSQLEFALDWETNDAGTVQGTQQVELALGDEQTDWDFREDAFTIIIKDAEGNALHSTPIDIDRLELNDQANTVVTSNTIKVYSPNDDAKDDIRVLIDEVGTDESHQTLHPHYHDTINPPPLGSIQPSHVFVDTPTGDGNDDTVEVEIDPEIEGYVHLLTVDISQIPLKNLGSYSLNNTSGTTYQYVIQSDSAEAPTVADLNLDKGGSVSPDSGIEVLGAFYLGKVTIGTSGATYSDNISPNYTGKEFTTDTSTSRTFFV